MFSEQPHYYAHEQNTVMSDPTNLNRRIYQNAGEMNCRKLKDYLDWVRSKEEEERQRRCERTNAYRMTALPPRNVTVQRRRKLVRRVSLGDDQVEKRRSRPSNQNRQRQERYIAAFPPPMQKSWSSRRFEDIHFIPVEQTS